MNYYNEFDPKAAAWLRELIAKGHLPEGDVDERNLRDVVPNELVGYRQCHFFAGIGGWPLALRYAGWPEDRPVWTGSCPCQPFSTAGRRDGTSDERHEWPYWFHLIAAIRPAAIFGEQVASPDGLDWFDLVCSDLEGASYSVGAADLCAAGLGAPHERQRLFFGAYDTQSDAWVAHGENGGRSGGPGLRDRGPDGIGREEPADVRCTGGVVNSLFEGLEGQPRDGRGSDQSGRVDADTNGSVAAPDLVGGLAHRDGDGRAEAGRGKPEARHDGFVGDRAAERMANRGCAGNERRSGPGETPGAAGTASGEARERQRSGSADRAGGASGNPSPTNGFWRDADWLFCRDGKWRPVRPGSFPLAHGVSGRVGLLRGYGNAIVPQVAATFVEAFQIARQ